MTCDHVTLNCSCIEKRSDNWTVVELVMCDFGVESLVADSGAFIKAAPLERWSKAVYTVKEVVDEIRDTNTRRRLQVLPYELVFREPSQEAIRCGKSE